MAGAKTGEKSEKPPAPHTFPEALCAYGKALRSCPCAAGAEEPGKAEKNGKDSAGEEARGKKSPPANGEADKKSNGKDNKARENDDKDKPKEPEGKKSPPANGETDTAEEDKKDAADDKKDAKEESKQAWYSAHAQATMDTQIHGPFRSPYVGMRSLLPQTETPTSLTATLFLAARLWDCDGYTGELIFNPELSGGSGFDGVQGVAGFTNGDITRVGEVAPTPYIARFFLRQTWGFGGEQETVEDEPNQIAGKRDVNRLTLSVGKFAFTDFIDNNRYSHDPRTQMQNWSLMYNGAWDYPANVRGYTYGLAVDYNQKDWALRYGITAEPEVANGAPIDPHFTKAFGQALEWEGRWAIDEHPGKLRLMAYLNNAHMGDYRETLIEMPVNPDVTQTRSYRWKYGCGLNVEQEMTRDLGVWGRLGWNDGHTETWAFTEIDRTAALGLSLKGRCWARPNDEFGLAGVVNGLSKDHRDYLAAGGFGYIIGDGRLNYDVESILEVYYRFAITKGIYVTADVQEIFNPAYNRDRGPVSVESLLVHLEF